MESRRKRRLLTSGFAVAITGFLGSLLIRVAFFTIRIRFIVEDPSSIPDKKNMPCIYVFWHEMLLLPVYSHSHLFTTLVSQNHDGELIARILRHFGGNVIRGSTTHGRLSAFRDICRKVEDHHVAIAADGPRGTARSIPAGIVRAASVTGKPIVPTGMAFEHCFRFGPRGHKVAFPWPFTRAWVVVGGPVVVPPMSRTERDAYRLQVQDAIDEVHGRAERLAARLERTDKSLSLKEVLAT